MSVHVSSIERRAAYGCFVSKTEHLHHHPCGAVDEGKTFWNVCRHTLRGDLKLLRKNN